MHGKFQKKKEVAFVIEQLAYNGEIKRLVFYILAICIQLLGTMSHKSHFKMWKTIIIHHDSKQETIIYDLDEKQRLKKKIKRLKKRSLILECASSSNNKLQHLSIQTILEKKKKHISSENLKSTIPNENNNDDSSILKFGDNNDSLINNYGHFNAEVDFDICDYNNECEIEQYDDGYVLLELMNNV